MLGNAFRLRSRGVADRLYAVKWRNWKMHLIWQVNMNDPPQVSPIPKIVNLLTDLKEERDLGAKAGWVSVPMVKILAEFQNIEEISTHQGGHAGTVFTAEVKSVRGA